MKKLVRWLHLSDFHVGMDAYGQRILFTEICEHLRDRIKDNYSPDFVFITGDLADKGRQAEYSEFFDQFLDPMLKSLGSSWSGKIFAVPGNHDVERSRAPYFTLGACLLNPGEMGFEPLKPVGEPDAANSRIRFDVRVEALRPSFVAPFPRWRSSAGCECGKGRGPPLGELQDIVGEADEAPLVGDLLDAAQEKLTEAARLLDLSEHRLGQLLS